MPSVRYYEMSVEHASRNGENLVKSPLRSSVFLVLLSTAGTAQDFSSSMKSVFTGPQYKGFQWLTYPLDNYGVGTAYSAQQKQFLCDTFPCLGLRPPDPLKDLNPWINVLDSATNTNYAAQAAGPPANLSSAKSKKVLIAAVLPKLLSVVGLDGSLDYSNDKTVTIGFAKAYVRELYPKPYLTRVTSGTDDKYGVRQAFERRDLVVVTADVVIEALSVKVEPNSKLGTKLKATAGEAVKDFSGASLNVQVDTSSKATYTVTSKSPFIVGIRPRQNPLRSGVGTTSIPTNWNTWRPIEVVLPAKR